MNVSMFFKLPGSHRRINLFEILLYEPGNTSGIGGKPGTRIWLKGVPEPIESEISVDELDVILGLT